MNVSLARTLRQGIQLKDPRLYELLGLLIDSAAAFDTDIAASEARLMAALGITTTELTDVTIFTYELITGYIRLEWGEVTGAAQYEIRKGTVWETADFILSSWEGALLRMKAESNTSPLILVEQMVFGRVLKQQLSTRSKSTQMRHR